MKTKPKIPTAMLREFEAHRNGYLGPFHGFITIAGARAGDVATMVDGHCMEPVYHHGEYLICRPLDLRHLSSIEPGVHVLSWTRDGSLHFKFTETDNGHPGFLRLRCFNRAMPTWSRHRVPIGAITYLARPWLVIGIDGERREASHLWPAETGGEG